MQQTTLRAGLFGLVLAAASGLTTSASATLFDRGNGLIYDDVLDVTWLQDANYIMTSGQDANGLVSWNDAISWAANLSYAGYDDWRLPSALNSDGTGPCSGFDCSDSEMGHLFYVSLGGTASSSKTGNQTSIDGVDLSSIQFRYWSQEFNASANAAWTFAFSTGRQFLTVVDITAGGESAAWAVRDGDVAVAEPAALPVFVLGLAGLLGRYRRRSGRLAQTGQGAVVQARQQDQR